MQRNRAGNVVFHGNRASRPAAVVKLIVCQVYRPPRPPTCRPCRVRSTSRRQNNRQCAYHLVRRHLTPSGSDRAHNPKLSTGQHHERQPNPKTHNPQVRYLDSSRRHQIRHTHATLPRSPTHPIRPRRSIPTHSQCRHLTRRRP